MVDFYNLDLNDNKVYEFLSNGKTKGIFQLESHLGEHYTKQLKPTEIEDLSALGTILRPGSLEAKIGNKNITQLFCDRKNGREPNDITIKCCEDILGSTNNLLIYQEQILSIVKKLAGFSLEEADLMRRCVGKKDVVLMSEMESKFLEGCKKVNLVSEEEAKVIFEMIRKSQRYLFNKCLSETTIVQTLDGPKTLKDITIGEYILCPNDNLNDSEYCLIINKFDNQRYLYEIELESGQKIQCSLDHKFLCDDMQIRPLNEIIEHDYKLMIKI